MLGHIHLHCLRECASPWVNCNQHFANTHTHDSFSPKHTDTNCEMLWRQIGPFCSDLSAASGQNFCSAEERNLMKFFTAAVDWVRPFLLKQECVLCMLVCVCVGWWGAACGGTVNMPVCLYTMCLCESWLCVGEKDMAVTRERDRERARQRGVVWGFSFSAISFPSVCPSLCSILTSIVLPFLFQRSFY